MPAPFHAFWDREQGVVALWSRDKPGERRARLPLFRVFLRAPNASGQVEDSFLGVFSSQPPAVSWLPSAWILLPVGNRDEFELVIETENRRRDMTQVQMQFDASMRFDFERGAAPNERRVYLAYNEIWQAETSGSRLLSRRRVRVTDAAPRGARTLTEFVEKFIETAKAQSEEPLLLLASYARGDRFGPVSKIWPTQLAQIDVLDEVRKVDYESRQDLEDRRRKTEEAGGRTAMETESSVFRHMLVDAKHYWQPDLSVSFGSSEEEADRLQRSVTFFHVKENVFTVANRRLEGKNAKGANRLQKLPDRTADSRADRAVEYRSDPHVFLPATELGEARPGPNGLSVTWNCYNIAMGDVVGLFVASDARLLLRGKDIFASGQHRQASAAQCMYFRFLGDQLVPMLPEKLDSHYASVSNDFSRTLETAMAEARFDTSARPRFDVGDADEPIGPPQTLTDLFYDAWDEERRALPPIHATTGASQSRSTAVDKIEFRHFMRWPHIMHALLRTPNYRKYVERRLDLLLDEDRSAPFLVTALELAGASRQSLAWAQQQRTARQQSIAWDILAYGMEYVDQCAEANLKIPDLREGRVTDLEGSIALMKNEIKLRRCCALLYDLGERAEAQQLESILGAITDRVDIDLKTLEEAKGLIYRAETRLEEDCLQAERIVEVCAGHSPEIAEFVRPDFERDPVTNEYLDAHKIQYRQETERLLDLHVQDPLDRLQVGSLLAGIRTLVVLKSIVLTLSGDKGSEEARTLVQQVALGLVDWSWKASRGRPGNAAASPASVPEVESGEAANWWSEWKIALAGHQQLAGDLTLERLAGAKGDSSDLWSQLMPARNSVADLLHEVRIRSRGYVKDLSAEARGDAESNLRALEQLADVAFASACSGALYEFAIDVEKYVNDYVRTQMPDSRQDDAGYLGAQKRLEKIRMVWDSLGRCLAPDVAVRMVMQALDKAHTLQVELRSLRGRTGEPYRDRELPVPRVDPIPRLALLLQEMGGASRQPQTA